MPVMNRSGLLSKAGLRRLLQSDEVWTLARKRNQVELVQAEQDILQFAESNNPPTSPSHRYARQSPQTPLRLINPERKGAGTPCQPDPVKTSKAGPDVNDQDTQKKVPGFYKNTRTSKSIESCRGERFQYPAEEHLKPVLNKQQCTHDHKPNTDSDSVHTGSNLSSDMPQDLQSRPDESHLKPKDNENIKTRTLVHSTETTALNVKNNQRSKNVLLLNNNHDICNEDSKMQWKSSVSYHKSDRDRKFSETNAVADTPRIENLILNTLNADTRSAEDGPYRIDEKSEVVSLHSKPLTYSEKKKDYLKEKNTDTSTFSVVYAEKYTVVPDASQFELDFNSKDGDGCNSGRTTAESLLSEILSPVDEVLSYGSAELPPSVKGGAQSGLYSYSGPPHPAFEIITWTSEEDLPAPPEFPEDLSINSENIPPLPVDVRRREWKDKEIDGDDANGDLCASLPPSVCEDDCSEYSSSLPDDVKNEISDPLSSFQIGDRVLVCNSRHGILKYKGLTAFADGFWAGVALDNPNGNHNGTFRGVKYFSCDKSHGVLVRAEDVSHIHRQHGSDIETGLDEDPFSDEEPPRHDAKKCTSSSVGAQGGDTNSQDDPKRKELQKDIIDGAKDLLYISKMPLPKIDYELIHHNKENRHLVDDSNHSGTRLTDESREDIIRCTEDTRRRRRRIKSIHDNTHINTDVRKNEDSHLTPRLLEQWHQVQPNMPLKIKVQPHDDPVVYRLVDAAVDILCGQANDDALDGCETPKYLLDDKSCKAYRQVIFQLTSDVLHNILGDLLRAKQSYHNICNESVISALPSCNISITLLKAAVKKEIQKTLNLERDEQHMTEMLQKLCKYWYAKRDRVDYILIQELHNDEKTWLDYTADQYTVKMRLTEEILSILLDDTIATLNHLHF